IMHRDEVFGPVATLAPARSPADLVRRGGGGLVCSVYSDDRDFLRDCVLAIAPYHGRIYIGSEKVAGQTLGPGTVLPQLLHAGPRPDAAMAALGEPEVSFEGSSGRVTAVLGNLERCL